MAEKALTLFLWFVMISVVCLPQTTTAQTGGGGGSPDGNDRNKVAVRGSTSNSALSKPGSSFPAGALNSSMVECNESTTYNKTCSGASGAMECHETVTRTTCSGTTIVTEYSNLETPPTDAGNFAAPPPFKWNRKLRRAL